MDVTIYIYFKDHNAPHFHAVYGEFNAEIDIQALKIIAGHLPQRQLKKVVEWAKDKQEKLLEEFIKLQ